MRFLLQVRLLLWKNFLLRKRQKLRCLVELLWPLMLFAILMWVRTRGLKKYVHECHFEEKALPSAGVLPFLQSFVCALNNTCHRTEQQSRGTLQALNSTPLWSVLDGAEGVLRSRVGNEEVRTIDTAAGDVLALAQLLTAIGTRQQLVTGSVELRSLIRDSSELQRELVSQGLTASVVQSILSVHLFPQNLTMGQLSTLQQDPRLLICDPETMASVLQVSGPASVAEISAALCALPPDGLTNVSTALTRQLKATGLWDQFVRYVELNLGRELSWTEWRQISQLSSHLFEDIQKLDSFQQSISEMSSVIRQRMPSAALLDGNSSLTSASGALSPSVVTSVALVQSFLCGPNTTNLLDQLAAGGGESTRFDQIKDQLKEMSESEYEEYVNDTEASQECNDLFKTLERNSLTRIVWNQVKPFVRGKILFSPNESAAIARVMSRVNESFTMVERLREAGQNFAQQGIPRIRAILADQTLGLKMLQDAWPRLRSALKRIMNSEMQSQFNSLEDYADRFLEENSTDVRESALDMLDVLQTNITTLLECFDVNKVEGYPSEAAAMERGMELLENNKLWAVVSFLDLESSETGSLPPFVSYKIRMDSDRVDSTKRVEDLLKRPGPRRRPAIDMKYLTYGFAYLQDMVDSSLIKEQSGRSRTPGIFLQQFPYPCHIIDRFVLAISRTFPLFMTLSWVYTSAMIVKSVVYEKEKRLRETMRVMGLSNGAHWIGWFIDSITPMILTIMVLTCILVYGRVLENSDPTLIFVFLMIFAVTTVLKSFLISVFFSKANLAAAAGGIIFFVLYLPYAGTVIWEERMPSALKAFACLLSNVAFGYGCSYLAHYEESGLGAQWSNFHRSPLLNDKLSLQACMLLLMLDGALYAALTWYIEAVFPGEYGVPKPWYFPVMKSYWCGKGPLVECQKIEPDVHPRQSQGDAFEVEPSDLSVGVSLQGLSKTYGNGKVALTDLSINFYQDQITAFLGHNGAGKTTTISILTGLFPPSRGTASINGLDIRKDMDSIRGSLGTCPQHNVLFDLLTVEEHLWFYARIKGRPEEEVRAESERMIADLGLPHKRAEQARNLSGGMQRKLSIAVAFVGGSKTVILDEPTSGVDPFSRRSIWELLIKYKKDRTVILTTHFMDEADLLADRIAILAGGRLRCCGSGLFLKARYGSGFYLTVERSDTAPRASQVDETTAQDEGSIQRIVRAVQTSVPNAALLEAVGNELVLVLPLPPPRTAALPALQALLNTLDAEADSLGINSYGLSDTSLEEIFLKVAGETDSEGRETTASNGTAPRLNNGGVLRKPVSNGQMHEMTPMISNGTSELKDTRNGLLPGTGKKKKKVIYLPSAKGNNHVTYVSAPTSEPVSMEAGAPCKAEESAPRRRKLRWRQYVALQTKRFHHTRRDLKALFCQIVLPALFVCLALTFTVIMPGLQAEPPLELEPWIYPPPNHVFLENQALESAWAGSYQRQLLGSYGMGTKCVGPRNGSCAVPAEILLDSTGEDPPPLISTSCSCVRGTQECPAGAGGPPPPKSKVVTGDFFLNMTGRNISDWLVKTEEQYYKIRYGGFSLGVHNPLSGVDVERLVRQLGRLDEAANLGTPRFTNYSQLAEALSQRAVQQDEFDNIKVWYNNKGWAASVAYLNAINNVVLRASLPENITNSEMYGIRTVNHPMDFTATQLSHEMIKLSGVSLLHAISVIFAMSFVPASFVVLLIEERASKGKHLQFVSGVDATVYWLAAYSWDMLSYVVSATLCVFIFLLFEEEAYVSQENLPGLVLLLLLYGWSSIPLMYPASFVASVPSMAFVFLACANLFVGVVTTVATFVLEIFDDEELQYIASILREVFLIFPHFCLGQGLMKMAQSHLESQTLASFGVELRANRFEWAFLGKNLFAMTVEGCLFFAFTLALQHGLCKKLWIYVSKQLKYWWPRRGALGPRGRLGEGEEEEDVAAERRRALREDQQDVLRLENLSKVYKVGARPAVDRLSLGVHQGECFGLLGLNGAGKTSTFKMLTGDTEPTAGDAWVCGHSVRRDMALVRRRLGYCPQFDALDPLLTAREHLEFYSRLRGVPSHLLPAAVDEGLTRLGLSAYADRCAGTYSGGNKRKLSTAISLVGNPPLVFLDEPTSGMDPAARRFLWRCILGAVREGRSVVLTSHSMEECQALCTRLTVMVNGQLACLGTAQHLKAKFGGGYTLVVRCPEERTADVEAHMQTRLPAAVLSESHHTRLRFQLPGPPDCSLAAALGALEEARDSNLLYDYSVSQTTLEDVFLRFANQQGDLASEGKWSTTCSCFRAFWSRKSFKIGN